MNRNPEVETYLKKKNHPLSTEINLVRKIILSVDDKIEETIKWSSPTFMYKGNIASFYMNAKKLVSLMFHTGASIADPYGLLEGEGSTSRVARFKDAADIEHKREALEALIKEWINMKDQAI